ncbi:hypothetical protein SAV14893_056260 [Streptomyces avermitilis]|uniref:Amine oxidase domain-containing protein n=1 Tax=Streptomyces avermitilis TaxID=33903 RepID=A0A4D4M331_STRAX|nr:hypothetical protein SAV14893_056260 [Streptomyces avermitilis]
MLESVHQASAYTADVQPADVVIVGAGAAGLAAAHHLTRAGLTTAVLEAAPNVGGRMSTEKVDGFRLDRMGQLLSTAYPELRSTPGLDALPLREFSPGVLVHSDGHLHRVGEPGTPRSARGALTAARALASAPDSSAHRAPPAPKVPPARACWAVPSASPGWPAHSPGSPPPRPTGCCPAPNSRPPGPCRPSAFRPARSTAFCAPCSPHSCATRPWRPPAAAPTWPCVPS